MPQQKKSPKPASSEPQSAVRKIDASGQSLGRIATQAAIILRGKDKPSFRPNIISGDKVLVINYAKIKITGAKKSQKLYFRHSGHPGHLRSKSLGEVLKTKPDEVLKRAIWGMLPKNKLRKIIIKNLEIRSGE